MMHYLSCFGLLSANFDNILSKYEFQKDKMTFKLNTGENIFNITVTAQNGEIRDYKINIIRVQDTTTVEELILKLGVKVNENYMYGMSVGTDTSTIIASILKIFFLS